MKLFLSNLSVWIGLSLSEPSLPSLPQLQVCWLSLRQDWPGMCVWALSLPWDWFLGRTSHMRTARLNVEMRVWVCPRDVTRFSISIPHVKWNQQLQEINKLPYMRPTPVRERTDKAATHTLERPEGGGSQAWHSTHQSFRDACMHRGISW